MSLGFRINHDLSIFPDSRDLYTVVLKRRGTRTSIVQILETIVLHGGTVEGVEQNSETKKLSYYVTLPKIALTEDLLQNCYFQRRAAQPVTRSERGHCVFVGTVSSKAKLSVLQDVMKHGARWTGYIKAGKSNNLCRNQRQPVYVFEGDEYSRKGWFGRPGMRRLEASGSLYVAHLPFSTPSLVAVTDSIIVSATNAVQWAVGKPLENLQTWIVAHGGEVVAANLL